MKLNYLPMIAVVALAGCAGPKFLSVTPHPIVRSSRIGAAVTYGGVQFWQNASPGGKYEVLGYVDDYWRGEELDEYDFRHLAAAVKKNGGDAGIVIRGDRPAPGLVRMKDEEGFDVLRLQVIKFL